jgi:hypothetical protein
MGGRATSSRLVIRSVSVHSVDARAWAQPKWAVFAVVAQFANDTLDAGHWVGEFENIALDMQ